jgi:hypothetical protein
MTQKVFNSFLKTKSLTDLTMYSFEGNLKISLQIAMY